MKIGIISDTHIPVNSCELPSCLMDALKDCDLIIHAGDLIDLCILEPLNKISRVEAVCGNMDPPQVKAKLKDKKILDICGKKLCLMHGYGKPENLIDVLKKEFLKEKPDIIVFGHSHMPTNEYIDGILFFNPGSATDIIFAPYRSYGIIEVTKDGITARIHKI